MAGKHQEFSLYRRNGVYYARIWNEELRRFASAKSTKTKNAHAAAVEAHRMLKAGEFRKLSEDPFLCDYVEEHWTKTKTQISKVYRRQNLNLFTRYAKDFPDFHGLRLSKIKKFHLNRFVVFLSMKKGLSPRVVQQALQSITVPLNFAFYQGFIETEVARGVQKPKFYARKKGILTIEELLRIIDLEPEKYRAKAVVLLGALAGLRRGEILGLRWKHVVFDYNYLDIKKNIVEHEEKNPKDDSFGKVVIAEPLSDVLKELRKESPFRGKENFVIYNEADREKFADIITVKRAFRTIMHAVGISDEDIKERRLCLHGLRHFFAAFSQAAGLNSFLASKLTRHKSMRVFERYSDHYEVIKLETARKVLNDKLVRNVRDA